MKANYIGHKSRGFLQVTTIAVTMALTPIHAQDSEMAAKLAAYEENLQQLNQEIASYERDAAALKAEIAIWEEEGRRYHAEAQPSTREVLSRDLWIDDFDQDYHDYAASKDIFIRDARLFATSLKEYHIAVSNLDYAVKEWQKSVADFNARVDAYNAETVAYDAAVTTHDNSVTAYNKDSAAYDLEVQQFNSLPDDKRTPFWFDRLTEAKADLDKRGAELDESKKTLDSRYDSLLTERAWFKEHDDQLRAEFQRIAGAEDYLNQQYIAFRDQVVTLKVQAQDLENLRIALERRNPALKGTLHSAPEEDQGEKETPTEAWVIEGQRLAALATALEVRADELRARKRALKRQYSEFYFEPVEETPTQEN